MQTLIAIGIVILAAAGVGYGLYRSVSGKSGCAGCRGCSMPDKPFKTAYKKRTEEEEDVFP